MAQYGDRLVCVWYRYDVKRGVRLNTVEIVVEEKPVTMAGRYRDGDLVLVVVAYGEKELRDRLKALGGRWDPREKLWRVPFGANRGDTELEDRIVDLYANENEKAN